MDVDPKENKQNVSDTEGKENQIDSTTVKIDHSGEDLFKLRYFPLKDVCHSKGKG